MAARRVATTSINWAAMADRVPANQKASFAAFKTKSDTYLRAVMANPEKPPVIDWAHYKKLIPIAGMVDTFQKQYEGLNIPYPTENVASQVEAQLKETKAEIDSFKRSSEERIADHQKQITHLKSLLPYEQMTMEDYRDAFPDQALDPINRPTFWPHTPEEQLDHQPKQEGGHH